MIAAEEAEFQFAPDSPLDWTETNYFTFNVPEARIFGSAYLVARPRLNVCMSDITIQDRISPIWEEQLYIDCRQHLPCPGSLLSYDLPNGLSVRCIDPLKRYQVDYVGIDETEFHLIYETLGLPFDYLDPEMDPMATRRQGPQYTFSGHFETTSHVQGTLVVRGKSYAVDCIATGDRSWGARPENEIPSVIWCDASFGKELTIHALVMMDPVQSSEFGALASGYVLEDGRLYGLTECHGTCERRGTTAMGVSMEAMDIRGNRYCLTGSTMSSGRWSPNANIVSINSFMRWNFSGRIGYGNFAENYGRSYLTRNRDRLLTI